VAHADLFSAAGHGDLDVVRRCLDAHPDSLDAQDTDGVTPLHAAAYMGQLEVVEYLIGLGAQLDQQTTYGNTALGYAARQGHEQVVARLLAAGAATELADGRGCGNGVSREAACGVQKTISECR